MSEPLEITESSSNIFLDLGFDEQEAANLQIMRGKIGAFSIDALVSMLAQAGIQIRIEFDQAA